MLDYEPFSASLFLLGTLFAPVCIFEDSSKAHSMFDKTIAHETCRPGGCLPAPQCSRRGGRARTMFFV